MTKPTRRSRTAICGRRGNSTRQVSTHVPGCRVVVISQVSRDVDLEAHPRGRVRSSRRRGLGAEVVEVLLAGSAAAAVPRGSKPSSGPSSRTRFRKAMRAGLWPWRTPPWPTTARPRGAGRSRRGPRTLPPPVPRQKRSTISRAVRLPQPSGNVALVARLVEHHRLAVRLAPLADPVEIGALDAGVGHPGPRVVVEAGAVVDPAQPAVGILAHDRAKTWSQSLGFMSAMKSNSLASDHQTLRREASRAMA